MEKQLVKLEMHLHTAEVSACAKAIASEVIYACFQMGYGSVIVTDHYLPGERETIEARGAFLEGYYNARKAGKQLGMVVLPGMEFRFDCGMEDFLVYGMEEADFRCLPDDLCTYSLADFYKYCSEKGWLVFQAHPFRPGLQVQPAQFLDGIEVFNGNKRHLIHNHNDYALDYARKNGLLEMVGTDVHEVGDVGGSCMYIPREMLTSKGIVEYLKTKRSQICSISV